MFPLRSGWESRHCLAVMPNRAMFINEGISQPERLAKLNAIAISQMKVLTEGLRYSKHAILREVVENEFAGEVPGEKCEAFTQKLLPLVGNVFSIYDLSDDNFALSPEYDLLYTELTGAVILYIEEYGV